MRRSASQNPSLSSLSMFTSYTLYLFCYFSSFTHYLWVFMRVSSTELWFCPFFLANFTQRHQKNVSLLWTSLALTANIIHLCSEKIEKKNHDYFLFSHLDYKCLENKNNLGIPTVPKPYKYLWLCTFSGRYLKSSSPTSSSL